MHNTEQVLEMVTALGDKGLTAFIVWVVVRAVIDVSVMTLIGVFTYKGMKWLGPVLKEMA